MRAVVQRVSRARVTVDENIIGEIGQGLVVLLGVAAEDRERDADYLLDKIAHLRIFEDSEQKMNLSVVDVGGAMLIVSQFTLYADTRTGRRPSFIKAAAPSRASELYEYFVTQARRIIASVETGQFRAMMNVELVNDGPVTIILDSARTI